MKPQQSQPRLTRRTVLEAIAWVIGITVLWGADTLARFGVISQNGLPLDTFRLLTGQITSALAALLMIGFVIYWLRLFPLRSTAWVPAIVGHTIGSIVFAFGHFSLQVAFRAIVYKLAGVRYIWKDPFVSNLIIEYQKDIKIYLGIVVVVSAYQYYRASRDKAPSSQAAARKLVVQTGSGEALVDYRDISHLEASRNYVVVHARDREFLVRDTITNMEKKLPAARFVRSHRSFIVNIDAVEEIRLVDNSYSIRLANGQQVPLSRSYREKLRAQIASASA